MTMSTAKRIEARLRDIPCGKVITYADFPDLAVNERGAVAQALSRLVKSGALRKLGRGRFYKPEMGRFGEMPIPEKEQLRPALEKGYVTGTEAMNRLGITTQLAMEVVVAVPNKAYSTKIGNIKVRYVRSAVDAKLVGDKTELLVFLDALKQIKRVQDASPDRVVSVLMKKLRRMERNKVEELTKLSMAYPPRARAILGAMLDAVGRRRQSAVLKNSLNPLSKYRVGIREALPNRREWNLA